jgi:Xanthomonas XOO_2897-like deaminase
LITVKRSGQSVDWVREFKRSLEPVFGQHHVKWKKPSSNLPAGLYQDQHGVQGIQVSPNTSIAELIRKFGPAQTPDAEVGFHSEMHAAEWFRLRPELRVLQIFSERIPCGKMCAPMLRQYFPGVPWFYYYDRDSWKGPAGEQVKQAASILKSAYGL